jgi:hypothetical protein
MADLFRTDPGLDLLIKNKDSDALIGAADASLITYDVNYRDFTQGVRLGRMAAGGHTIWEVATSERNVVVYFVGSLEDTIRRIAQIPEATDDVAGNVLPGGESETEDE